MVAAAMAVLSPLDAEGCRTVAFRDLLGGGMRRSRWEAFAVLSVLLVGTVGVAAPAFHYYGGKVVSNAKVVQVLWGTGFSTDVHDNLAPFYTDILASPYMDWLSEYSTVGLNGFVDGQPGSNQRIGRGTFVGTVAITPSTNATTLSNTTIASEISAQIAAGHLPAPTFDWQGNVNTLYMIDFPSGYVITVSGGQSCQQFCGIFDTLVLSGKSVGLGIFPDITSGGCQTGCGSSPTALNNITWVHSLILLDVVTDTEIGIAANIDRPMAWYSNAGLGDSGNIADVCSGSAQATVAGHSVAMGWSQTENTCVATVSNLAVCDGSTTHCRECSAADNGQATGCTGAKAVCETDGTNSAFGECVACATNAQCSGVTPVCNKVDAGNDTCRACGADADCTGNAAGPHCLSTGACGAAPAPDAGTGGGGGGAGSSSSGGCSTTGSGPAGPLAILTMLAVLLGRRRPARLS